MHSNWRDCQAWSSEALELSSTSNEAVKLYDATLTQYVGWYDDDSVGGIEKSCTEMMMADPMFVMGLVLSNGLELMGTGRSPRLDPQFQKDLDDLKELAGKAVITPREKQHAQAIDVCGQGFMAEACQIWEDILVEHPTDMLAVKFAHDCYFYLGYQPQMRDSIARVLPNWSKDAPLYSYLHGMYSFGLCETNMYTQAEAVAREGLNLNPRDAWSTHSLAHVLEMQGRYKEGISFMSKTVADWASCGMLACHNYWHWAVYHLEKGESQGAVDIFDAEILERANKSGAMLDIVDAASMLWRLQMEGVDVGPRWTELCETCRPHSDDHILAFNDMHLLMSFLGADQKEATQKMMDSIQEFVSSGKGTNHQVMREVGEALAKAFVAYNDGDYGKAVDLMYPKRYKVVTIGGSNAQRDVFSQFLINACLKSPQKAHNRLARHLLAERKALKEDSPLTDRLIEKAMLQHVD